jgi:hypothetical protein
LKTSLALWLANGDKELAHSRTVILNGTASNITIETYFKIRAWAKANKLRGREYLA